MFDFDKGSNKLLLLLNLNIQLDRSNMYSCNEMEAIDKWSNNTNKK